MLPSHVDGYQLPWQAYSHLHMLASPLHFPLSITGMIHLPDFFLCNRRVELRRCGTGSLSFGISLRCVLNCTKKGWRLYWWRPVVHLPVWLVGRLSTILGSRTLALLHDASGHPLAVTTHRGDLHVTGSLPVLIKQYEQEAGPATVQHLVVDGEGMAAEFLAALKKAGRTAISVLRTDQYDGLDSFTDIGAFVPLHISKHGGVLREVAPQQLPFPCLNKKGRCFSFASPWSASLRSCTPNERRAGLSQALGRWSWLERAHVVGGGVFH